MRQEEKKYLHPHQQLIESVAEVLYEAADEVEKIKEKVATLKVGDKTNFGVVTKITDKSIEFKARDLGKTDILFTQRKMGSKEYVLSKLAKA